MLTKPRHGWTTVTINEFVSEASYVVDIPFEWLTACLNGLVNKTPISLYIDEEGSEVFITTYYGVTHIIVDRDDDVQCITYRDIDYMDFVRNLLQDIKLYFSDWVQWSPYENTKSDFEKRSVDLELLITDVEKALQTETQR